MSGGKTSVQCLLCPKNYVVRDILEHIHGHIKYKPQKCNDCDFDCIQRNELDQHTFENEHTGRENIDTYKQWLVDTINEDTRFAAKNGKEELLKRKNIDAVPLASTPTLPSSSSRTPSLQKQKKHRPPTPIRVPPTQVPTSPSDDEEEEREPPQKPAAKPEVARGSSDQVRQSALVRKQQKHLDEGESEEDLCKKNMKELRKELEKYEKCTICCKKVCINLVDRLAHIIKEHMNDDDVVKGQHLYKEQLEKKMLAAFPEMVSNSLQCRKCKKNIATHSGRISHVITYHNTYFPLLNCPKNGCRFSSYDTAVFKPHFMESHASTKDWKLFLIPSEHYFLKEFDNHKSRLEDVSKLLFTMDIPARKKDTPKRKAGEDDDDADIEELRAIKASVPKRPTLTLPKAKKKRSDSSSEEDDSDDDKKPISKMQNEKEKIDRYKLSLVEVSSDEEEEGVKKEGKENMDDSMDVDNGSASGRSLSIVSSYSDKTNKGTLRIPLPSQSSAFKEMMNGQPKGGRTIKREEGEERKTRFY